MAVQQQKMLLFPYLSIDSDCLQQLLGDETSLQPEMPSSMGQQQASNRNVGLSATVPYGVNLFGNRYRPRSRRYRSRSRSPARQLTLDLGVNSNISDASTRPLLERIVAMLHDLPEEDLEGVERIIVATIGSFCG
ncbi:hypothetical protein KFL_010390040 [Klebsormidium nitens]|uniref:Uncharacterized protein n=1 Tax=Klebsormidium nitens TaxID=105231 RepID=A0A1Y1IPE3_KLENI|nr:hypothetical protein KFL_010390040 [Klebsormidium nitens]|eukprot:GAQ92523.1 hypothetical protein KFL_010390040 [Klebsormidium nitens]